MILKNKTHLKDMTEIMDNLSKYVPVHVTSKTVTVEGNACSIDDSRMVQILLFGDQLTTARARGAITLRDDDTSALHQLEADWHARMCLLQVIYNGISSDFV